MSAPNGDSMDGFVFPPFIPASRAPQAPPPAPAAAPAPVQERATLPWDVETPVVRESSAEAAPPAGPEMEADQDEGEELPWLEVPAPRAADASTDAQQAEDVLPWDALSDDAAAAQPWTGASPDDGASDQQPWASNSSDEAAPDELPWVSAPSDEATADQQPWSTSPSDGATGDELPWASTSPDEGAAASQPWSSASSDNVSGDELPWASTSSDQPAADQQPWTSASSDQPAADAQAWSSEAGMDEQPWASAAPDAATADAPWTPAEQGSTDAPWASAAEGDAGNAWSGAAANDSVIDEPEYGVDAVADTAEYGADSADAKPWSHLDADEDAPAGQPAAAQSEEAFPDWLAWDARAEAEASEETNRVAPLEGLNDDYLSATADTDVTVDPSSAAAWHAAAPAATTPEPEEEFSFESLLEPAPVPAATTDFAAAGLDSSADDAPAADPFEPVAITETEALPVTPETFVTDSGEFIAPVAESAPAEAAVSGDTQPLQGAFEEAAARLEQIARTLRENPDQLLSGAAGDPLALLVTGYVLGAAHGAQR